MAASLALMMAVVRSRTVVGFSMAVLEDNPTIARLSGIRVGKYYFWCLAIAGGIAAVAGMVEVSTVQGRLRPDISPGYGYNGFLVSWLAGHRPVAILIVSFLVGGLFAGSDSLQVSFNLPFSIVNILLGLVFVTFLAADRLRSTPRRSSS
jgi:simple sugar transport system permease protein